ncbi:MULTISPECIES: hypothetical protein [Catenuloplanes]|uniref:Secreted protein n=1 Tax=Catenuloplanes niger TaxID=587534 RepID=A0AAE3ZUF2_9ACTN|nr:hypothetical protein [Catenuloplanes niger]MDR7326283.1 hypothetical protein [Catenuloplanes niger]
MRQRTLMIATLATAIALLGACGGRDGAAEPDRDAGPPATYHEWSLAYATCMREQGVDMPDPKPGEGLSMPMGGPGADATVEASQACRARLGDPPAAEGAPKTDQEREEQQLKMVQCLREHGVDVPDPQPGQGLAFDLSWPAEALEACGLPVPGAN